MRKKLFILSLSSLFLGILIYLLLRVSTLRVFSWLSFVGIDFLNSSLRTKTLNFASHIPEWFVFSFPDGLWIFSYIILMLSIWNLKISKQNIFWLIIIPFIAILSEILQIFGIISGTFDIFDLTFYLLGFISPFIILKKRIKYNF